METHLHDFIRETPEGREAEKILRACVHCGFCLATCPTYQLTGDELDSPRGRIYLMKQMLEGNTVTRTTQEHLDRCLTCLNCQTTCPSGVQYGRLINIGRHVVAQKVARPLKERAMRYALARTLPNPGLFAPLLAAGRAVKPLLPQSLGAGIPTARPAAGKRPAPRHARRMLLLEGCVQPHLAPGINEAAARVLDQLGISLVSTPAAGCCGALSYHLDAQAEGLDAMRRNIDAWLPALEAGAEAVIMTASGCGAMVREYGHHLQTDAGYAQKGARISAATRDIAEVLLDQAEALAPLLAGRGAGRRIAWHPPCSLQHAQKITGVVEKLLRAAGFELVPVPDSHLCCGSAGTYSILQKELSDKLLANKVAALESGQPEMIVSANIGCLTHIQGGTRLPVRHWIELVDELLH